MYDIFLSSTTASGCRLHGSSWSALRHLVTAPCIEQTPPPTQHLAAACVERHCSHMHQLVALLVSPWTNSALLYHGNRLLLAWELLVTRGHPSYISMNFNASLNALSDGHSASQHFIPHQFPYHTLGARTLQSLLAIILVQPQWSPASHLPHFASS